MKATVTVALDEGTTYTFDSSKWEFDTKTESKEVPCPDKRDCGWVHRQPTGRAFVTIKAETPHVDVDAAG